MRPAIVHAASFAAPYGGNFIASLGALAGGGEEQGYSFVLALPAAAAQRDWCVRLVAEGHQVRFLPDDASLLRIAWALAGLAATSDAALIHSHFSRYDVAAWIARGLLRLRRRHVKVVWHAHSDFPVHRTRLRSAKDVLKYRMMGRGVRMIAVSDHIRRRVIAAGFHPAAVVTVANGIDFGRALAAARSRAEVRQDWQVSLDAPVLLLFGWEPTVKGVDVAMNAVASLAKRSEPVVLAIIGTAALREYVARATAGGLPEWLRILPPSDDVADFYQASDVFVSASRNEGFPYSICEAIVNRLPAVVSDLPGVSWARRVPGAVFFPSGDPTALAEAVREVLNWGVEERQQRTSAGERLVRQELDISTWVERVLTLYGEILGPRPERRPG